MSPDKYSKFKETFLHICWSTRCHGKSDDLRALHLTLWCPSHMPTEPTKREVIVPAFALWFCLNGHQFASKKTPGLAIEQQLQDAFRTDRVHKERNFANYVWAQFSSLFHIFRIACRNKHKHSACPTLRKRVVTMRQNNTQFGLPGTCGVQHTTLT